MFILFSARNCRVVGAFVLALATVLTLHSQPTPQESPAPPDLLVALRKDLPDLLDANYIDCFQHSSVPFEKHFTFWMFVKSRNPPTAICVSPIGPPCWPSTN